MENKAYILIPVHNRKEETVKLFNVLKGQSYKNFKVVLIDDGSNDNIEDILNKYFPDSKIIKGKGNWWWCRYTTHDETKVHYGVARCIGKH